MERNSLGLKRLIFVIATFIIVTLRTRNNFGDVLFGNVVAEPLIQEAV
jgi:hypothetical protein